MHRALADTCNSTSRTTYCSSKDWRDADNCHVTRMRRVTSCCPLVPVCWGDAIHLEQQLQYTKVCHQPFRVGSMCTHGRQRVLVAMLGSLLLRHPAESMGRSTVFSVLMASRSGSTQPFLDCTDPVDMCAHKLPL
eukprot:m.1037009 g.1037009  ORF g.1037009 m.1037009 type:complete len:135 (+) comp24141_c0_seq5:2165-2569(+)